MFLDTARCKTLPILLDQLLGKNFKKTRFLPDFSYIFVLFVLFSFLPKNVEKADFDQRLECAALNAGWNIQQLPLRIILTY